MPPQKAKLVSHHDDPPCTERLEPSGLCGKCGYHPDMQSLALWYYCPTCDVPLASLSCKLCKTQYDKP